MNFVFLLPQSNTVQLSTKTHDFVIPAKAGIHERLLWQQRRLDSRLRGNDDLKCLN